MFYITREPMRQRNRIFSSEGQEYMTRNTIDRYICIYIYKYNLKKWIVLRSRVTDHPILN